MFTVNNKDTRTLVTSAYITNSCHQGCKIETTLPQSEKTIKCNPLKL